MTTGQQRGWVAVVALCLGSILAFGLVVTASSDDPELRSAPTPPRAPPVTETAIGPSAEHELEVHLLLPARILAGNSQTLHLEVTGSRGRPLTEDQLLEVRVRTELVDEARGHVWITPAASLTTAAGLRSRPLELASTVGLACDVPPGTLSVAVRTLDADGPSGEASAQLPVWPCDVPSVPEAPESIHIDTPVCGDEWRDDLEMLVAGRTPPPRWCRPAARASDRGEPTNDASSATEGPAEAPPDSPSEPDPPPTEPDPDPPPAEPDPPPAEPDPPVEPDPDPPAEPDAPAEPDPPAEPGSDPPAEPGSDPAEAPDSGEPTDIDAAGSEAMDEPEADTD
jgi:hypothetical protein